MCVMGTVLTSCGDDKEDDSPTTLSVTPGSISLYYEDTQQLSAAGATSWSSENEFIAILKKYNIPFEEKDGVYCIYGYR